MKTRVLGLLFAVLAVAALVLAACGDDEADDVPGRPIVRLEAGGQTYEENVYSYCWPEAADNLVCDVDAVALAQPVENITVAPGDQVRFALDDPDTAAAPRSFTATLLGFDQVQDYGSATEGVFVVALPEDLYRVKVDVEYADIRGYEAYVSYVFGLDVTTAIDQAAEPLPTDEAETPSAIAEVTEPTEVQPTPIVAETETPFMTPTFVPTSTPLPTDTLVAEDTAADTSTPTDTVVAPDDVAADTPTPPETMLAPADAAAETLSPIPSDMPAPSATPAPSNTPEPTATPVPTEAPTDTPTPLPTDTPVPTLAPSLTPTPSAVPTETPLPIVPVELGEVVLNGVVRLRTAGVTVPVVGADVSFIHTSPVHPDRESAEATVTDAGGRFEFEPIALNAADEVVVTAYAPGFQPQSIVRTGALVWEAEGRFQFVLEPVKAEPQITPRTRPIEALSPPEEPQAERPGDGQTTFDQPVTAPSAADSAPASLVPESDTASVAMPTSAADVPALTLVFAGQLYAPMGYQFCQRSASGERLCLELPAENAVSERIHLLRGTAAQMSLAGVRPAEVTLEYLSDSGAHTGQPETRPGDNTLLFVITPESGSYIMAIHAHWASSEATYYYRVLVAD